MADDKARIEIDTSVDTSGYEKGISKLENEVIKSAAKQTETIQKAAQEQLAAVREAETEKIAEIKKSLQEQIAAAKEVPGLDKAAMNEQIRVIRETENAKIKAVKEGTKLQETAIKNLADKEIKIITDASKKAIKNIKDTSKTITQSLKDFGKGAVGELLGVDQVLAAVAGGPVALGKAFVDMGKQAVAALNEMSAMYRQQEQAEIALQNAAKNNPYLNDRNVKQLKSFADEMQRVSGMDNVQILQTETRLATLGRNQEQIQRIIKTAADLAASGVMDFDSAVNELNRSLNGVVGRASGQLVPALKDLTAEELAAGKAMDILAEKVGGAAAESMKSGAGSVTAYQNAVGDLKKIIGEGWEKVLRGPREALTKLVNWYSEGFKTIRDTLNWSKDIEAAKAFVQSIDNEIAIANSRIQDTIDNSVEYQRLNALYLEALENGDIALRNHYAEQKQAIIANLEIEAKALEEKKNQSSQYMDLLEKEMRALEVLYLIENGGKQGVDYSIIERKRAEEYLRQYEITAGKKLEIDERQQIVWAKIQEANAAQERKRQNDINNQNTESAEERKRKTDEFRKLNQEALDAEIEKILRKAEIERKNKDDISVQKQILDAQVTAYENLLSAAKGYIDGTAQSEQERFANLKKSWADYEARAESEKRTDEERKQRLADLIKQQEDAKKTLEKLNEDLQGEARTLAEEKIQREITDIREKNAREGIERQERYELEKLKELNDKKSADAKKAAQEQINAILELRDKDLENTKLTEAEKEQIRKKAIDDVKAVEAETQAAITQITQNEADARVEIERKAHEEILNLNKKLLQEEIAMLQEYMNAASSIAGNISTIWHNSIDYELNEKLRANDKIEQSEEEKAEKEKELAWEAAVEKYKADMFAWNANIILAEAQMALAMLTAFTKGMESGGPPMAGLMMALAGVVGVMQVAAIISAEPKRPRFHEGGMVQGYAGQEVPAVLKANEAVLTQEQFSNTMQAISNLADMKTGGGGNNIALTVNVEDRVPNTKVDSSIDETGLKIVIREIVNEQMSNGGLDSGFAGHQLRNQGYDIQT